MIHKLDSKEKLLLIAIILVIGFIYSLFKSEKGTIIDILINSKTYKVAVPENRIEEISSELF
tara:strand:+ start:217 stop:402 length:186 start_codon:yes stop_codon:yes gene_type:complete